MKKDIKLLCNEYKEAYLKGPITLNEENNLKKINIALSLLITTNSLKEILSTYSKEDISSNSVISSLAKIYKVPYELMEVRLDCFKKNESKIKKLKK